MDQLSKSSKFKFKLLPEVSLERVEKDGKRFYVTPDGEHYPSVTTVLSTLSKEGLVKWRERVGEEEANKVMRAAASRGTMVHNLMEDYVLGKEDFIKKANPVQKMLFRELRDIIDEKCNNILGVELFLYSTELKTAGSSDLICEWDRKGFAVVDYKTSNKSKEGGWIENYFLQSTAYAMMVEERYGISVPNIVILIAVEDDKPQIFVRPKSDYVDKVRSVFKSYHLNLSK